MSVSHVYVLESVEDKNYVKIGKADDVVARMGQIGTKVFNTTTAKAIVCKNARQAIALERYLHTVFEEERAPKATQEDGATEWFRCNQQDVLSVVSGLGHKIVSVELNNLSQENKRTKNRVRPSSQSKHNSYIVEFLLYNGLWFKVVDGQVITMQESLAEILAEMQVYPDCGGILPLFTQITEHCGEYVLHINNYLYEQEGIPDRIKNILKLNRGGLT